MAGENDKWEFYEAGDGWRWRRTSPNGNIVGAASEGYNKKSDAEKNAQRHGMQGNPENYGEKDKWEFYEAGDGWRWRRTASNGNIVGACTQGYSKKSDMVANAQRNGYTEA